MKRHLNLMTSAARRREIVLRGRRRWSRLLVGVVVVLLPLGGARWWSYHQVQQRLHAIKAKYEPMQNLRQEILQMQEQFAAIEHSSRLLLQLAEEKSVVGLLGWTGQKVAEQQGALYLQQLQIEREWPLNKRTPDSSLALEGTSRDVESIEELVESLRAGAVFREIEFHTNRVQGSNGQLLHDFSVDCRY